MLRFLRNRLLTSIPVLIVVSLTVFVIMYLLPGDPAELMLVETGASKEAVTRLRTQMGLDDPAYVQYGRFVWKALQGDFGRSLRDNRLVLTHIKSQLPATLELALAGLGIAVVLGLITGTIAALRRGTWIDSLVMTISLVGVTMPIFWSGLLLVFFFSIKLGWFPATGQGGLTRLVLPALALGFSSMGLISRLTRSSVLEVLHQDFVRTAHAKGLTGMMVVVRHVLRNAFISIITMIGLQFGQLASGAVVTEAVFARQGVGTLTVQAIMLKDFPVVQATILLSAVVYMAVNLLMDLSYGLIDPRIRVAE